jgi:hypothetical protein
MSTGIDSLHKILKDETRRKIILQLHEKSSLSYVDLMKALGITNTGKMNYHLKILNDFLLKREDGQYMLSEKGEFACRLLLEFPEKMNQTQTEAKLPRWFLIVAGIVAAVFVTGFSTLYIRGIIDFVRMMASLLIVISALVILIVSDKVRKISGKWSPQHQSLGRKILYTSFGALTGATIFVTVGSLLLFGFETLLQSAGIRFVLFPVAWWLIISFVLGPILGSFVGYLLYKRSRYSKSTYYDPFA